MKRALEKKQLAAKAKEVVAPTGGKAFDSSQLYANMNMAILKAKQLPPVEATDEDLGVAQLHEILPDSWKNISWVIQNAIELLVQ